MFRHTSKHPEIFVRLDVRLNVLEFSNVYTYFLGRLDVNPKSFWFIQVVLKMMMMMKMMKMMDWIAWIASIMTMVMVMKGLKKEGCEKMAKASQGVGATRLAKQMSASALNHIWFAILDAMEGLRTPERHGETWTKTFLF